LLLTILDRSPGDRLSHARPSIIWCGAPPYFSSGRGRKSDWKSTGERLWHFKETKNYKIFAKTNFCKLQEFSKKNNKKFTKTITKLFLAG
jgi:hypothetical protein